MDTRAILEAMYQQQSEDGNSYLTPQSAEISQELNTPDDLSAGIQSRRRNRQYGSQSSGGGGMMGGMNPMMMAKMLRGGQGGGFAPSGAAPTAGTESMDFGAGFGTTGNSMVNAGASAAPMGAGDFAGSAAAGSEGSGLMDFGASFGSTGSSTVTPGTSAAGASNGGWMNSLGIGGGQGGLSYASAAGGALNGYMAGRDNYKNDPNMSNQKDGFGTNHKDYRAEIGGGTLGGVMGYYGGPIGAALAGPTVKAVHPFMEKGTRGVINFGDKVGGESGALALDPIGTMASGKYSWGDLGKGALLGPAKKWFNL